MTTNTLEKPTTSDFELAQKNQPLHDSVRQSLENFLAHLKGQSTVRHARLISVVSVCV
jgi:DNA-binding protein Fis